jgi:phosphopantothenoylcysteine decarboxylase/phosphopantothenate--cysteine ligase
VLAELGHHRRDDQWVVGFALETQDHHARALRKLKRKRCDLIVLNTPGAMNASDTRIDVLNPRGQVVLSAAGSKSTVARRILTTIEEHLIARSRGREAPPSREH